VKPLAPLDPFQRYMIPEANAYLRQSNARTYQQIKAGELHVIKDGGRTYVPGSEIIRRSTHQITSTSLSKLSSCQKILEMSADALRKDRPELAEAANRFSKSLLMLLSQHDQDHGQ
jgi:hypothetical protein